MAGLEQFDGKRVVVTHNTDNGAEQIEGKVETGNALGLLIKPKGKTNLQLILADTIEDVQYAAEPVRELKQKELAPIGYGQVRRHLLDRHGYTLKDINQMDEAQAHQFHNDLDHSELGHTHVEKTAEPEAETADEDAA